MRERLARFMQGRYGVDGFSRFLLVVGLVGVFGAAFFDSPLLCTLCNTLGWLAVLICYFRIFSRNVQKRYEENQMFLAKTAKVRATFHKQLDLLKQRKEYHIYKCPTCKQKIRIPRGKGKIEVRCPKCGATFIKNS